MKTTIVLALAVVAQAVGNMFLSMGMKEIASAGAEDGFSILFLVQAMGNPLIWIGILLLILFFALFSASLSWADLSFVIPIISFVYILNVVLAWIFLNESVSATRWAGTLVIFVGVALVAQSGKEQGSPGKTEILGSTGNFAAPPSGRLTS